jgi:hypothetical protein
MLCDSYTSDFKWFIQNHKYITNLRILKLGRCDVLLGDKLVKKLFPNLI